MAALDVGGTGQRSRGGGGGALLRLRFFFFFPLLSTKKGDYFARKLYLALRDCAALAQERKEWWHDQLGHTDVGISEQEAEDDHEDIGVGTAREDGNCGPFEKQLAAAVAIATALLDLALGQLDEVVSNCIFF